MVAKDINGKLINTAVRVSVFPSINSPYKRPAINQKAMLFKYKIKYPDDGDVNVPPSFTAKWTAVGAGFYDFIIRDQTTDLEVYGASITNSIDTNLSQRIPPNVLSPNTTYEMTIEALAPEVNGGQKGIKRSVVFTTGN